MGEATQWLHRYDFPHAVTHTRYCIRTTFELLWPQCIFDLAYLRHLTQRLYACQARRDSECLESRGPTGISTLRVALAVLCCLVCRSRDQRSDFTISLSPPHFPVHLHQSQEGQGRGACCVQVVSLETYLLIPVSIAAYPHACAST